MTAPAITVYAQLPKSSGVLTLSEDSESNWQWAPWLCIPLATLRGGRFVNSRGEPMRSPFKWIRFLAGITLGAVGYFQVRGGMKGFTVYDMNSPLPNESIELYYYVELDTRRRMLPSDPGMLDERTTTHTSRRDPEFARRIEERDGTCALTNIAVSAEATHIVPLGKGDKYIHSLTSNAVDVRGYPGRNDIVSQINDVRNGVYLNPSSHRRWAKSVACMVTPNLAMEISDLDPHKVSTEYCCTIHVFQLGTKPPEPILGARRYGPGPRDVEGVFSGASVRHSATNWPPDTLFNVTYGTLALKEFGFKDSTKMVDDIWEDTLRPGVIETSTQRAKAQLEAENLTQNARSATQSGERRARARRGRNPNANPNTSAEEVPSLQSDDSSDGGTDSSTDDIIKNLSPVDRSFYRFCLPELVEMIKRGRQEREAASRAASIEKVSHWLHADLELATSSGL